MLKYRILTAVLLIPFVIWAIFELPSFAFNILSGLVIAMGAWEWSQFAGLNSLFFRLLYVLVILIGLLLVFWLPSWPVLCVGFLSLLWFLTGIYCYEQTNSAMFIQYPVVRGILGLLILLPCWMGLIALRQETSLGPILLLFGMAVIWVTDSGAYFSGKIWGKNSLAPKTSPKKSWEGFWGGMILTIVLAGIGSFWLPLSLRDRLLVWFFACLAALFSVVGDLSVSLLKRFSGVKDSGHILPGHGGILDRMDSIAAGIIVFALGILMLGI